MSTECGDYGKAVIYSIAELVPYGYRGATTDIDTVQRWWFKNPAAYVGTSLAQSNLVVVVEVPPDLLREHWGLRCSQQQRREQSVAISDEDVHRYFYVKPARCLAVLEQRLYGCDIAIDRYIVAPHGGSEWSGYERFVPP